MLKEGDPRTLGRAREVQSLISPANVAQLIACWTDADPVVQMRAVNVTEKLSRQRIALFEPFKPLFIDLLDSATEKQIRWNLASIVPRLRLSRSEAHHVAEMLMKYLNDSSSIVKTLAIQGLWDLTRIDPGLRPEVLEILRMALATGTKAMQARSRNLLKDFHDKPVKI